MRKKYNVYMNVIYETPIEVGQVEPPYTFVSIAKRLLTEENDNEDKIFWCWRYMRNHIVGTDVSAQKVDDLFGERIKEIIVNRKLKAIQEDFE